MEAQLNTDQNSGVSDDTKTTISDTTGKITEALVKKYGKTLVGEAGAALAGGLTTLIIGSVLDAIFPPEEKNALNYTKIKDIFEKVINQNELNNLTTDVYSVWKTDIHENYAPSVPTAKTAWSSAQRNNCLGILKNAIGSLTGNNGSSTFNLARLANETFGISGLPVYMWGASLNLVLLQEEAMIYYMSTNTSDKYQYKSLTKTNGIIANTAQDHINDVNKNWQDGIGKRIDKVTFSYDTSNLLGYVTLTIKDGSNEVLTKQLYYGGENDLPQSSGAAQNYLSYFANEYKALYYSAKVMNQYSTVMGYPDAVIDKWACLKEKPMGIPTGEQLPDPTSLEAQLQPGRKDYFLIEMEGGMSLTRKDRIYSLNRRFFLEFSATGTLQVVRRANLEVMWSLDKSTPTAETLNFSTSGDLQILDGTTILWSAGTSGNSNYLIVGDSGILQVRTSNMFGPLEGNGLLWNTDYGQLPEGLNMLSTPGASVYTPTYSKVDMAALVFRQLDTSNTPQTQTPQIMAAASLDGVNWPRGAFQFPERMTTLNSPAANGFHNSIITVFNGNGNFYLYLNQSDPYANSFGGLVELDQDNHYVTTQNTPAIGGLESGEFGVYYTGHGNSNIYLFSMPDISDSSGTLTNVVDNATNSTPCKLTLNGTVYFIYRGAGQDEQLYYNANASGAKPIPESLSPTGPATTLCDGKIYMAWQGLAQKVWFNYFDGQTWSHPIALREGSVYTDAAPALITLDGKVILYFKEKGSSNVLFSILNQ